MQGVEQVANQRSCNARQHVGSSPTDGCDTLPAEESEGGLALSPGRAEKREPELSHVIPKWISPGQDDHEDSRFSFSTDAIGTGYHSCKL